MRVLLPNFDFDDVLAGRTSQLSAASLKTAEDLAPLFAIFGDSGDLSLCTNLPAGIPECYSGVRYVSADQSAALGNAELFPFGWTEGAREIAKQFGMDTRLIPSADVVYAANSRAFNAAFDHIYDVAEESIANHFGRISVSERDVSKRLAELNKLGHDEWLVKPQISHAGRNRISGRGTALSDSHLGWLKRNLSVNTAVYVEPRVQIDSEWGLQFEISSSGAVNLLGVTKSILMSNGQYIGSTVDVVSNFREEPQAAVEHAGMVCAELHALGYQGPVGIDCFCYFDAAGRRLVRLCGDINARVTMGRMALEFVRKVSCHRFNLWRLFKRADFRAKFPQARNTQPTHVASDVEVHVVSPAAVGDRESDTIAVLFSGDRLSNVLTVGKAASAKITEGRAVKSDRV